MAVNSKERFEKLLRVLRKHMSSPFDAHLIKGHSKFRWQNDHVKIPYELPCYWSGAYRTVYFNILAKGIFLQCDRDHHYKLYVITPADAEVEREYGDSRYSMSLMPTGSKDAKLINVTQTDASEPWWDIINSIIKDSIVSLIHWKRDIEHEITLLREQSKDSRKSDLVAARAAFVRHPAQADGGGER